MSSGTSCFNPMMFATILAAVLTQEAYTDPPIKEKDRTHWAFRQVERTVPPGASGHPIDRFINHRLDLESVRPHGETDRQTPRDAKGRSGAAKPPGSVGKPMVRPWAMATTFRPVDSLRVYRPWRPKIRSRTRSARGHGRSTSTATVAGRSSSPPWTDASCASATRRAAPQTKRPISGLPPRFERASAPAQK